jgi:hypothetical protein
MHVRRYRSALAAGLLAGLAVLLWAPVAQAADSCPSYLFIGARGSGDAQSSMGAAVEAEWTALQTKLGGAVSIDKANIRYPARPVVHDYSILGKKITFLDFQSRLYLESLTRGVVAAAREANRCKKSKLILAGHSQGAHALFIALRTHLIPSERVVAVTLFGDPMFHAESYASQGDFDASRNGLAAIPDTDPYPAGLKGRFFDWCNARDPVCQGFVHCFRSGLISVHCDIDFSAHTHSTYAPDRSRIAAGVVARLIRDDQAAHGRPLPEPTPESKGPVDVAFAIDTTGSMQDVIDSVRDDVQTMAGQIANVEPDFRLALVAYRDGPPDCDDDYQAQTAQDFTTDVASFGSAVESLVADGGCDTEESLYTGAMQGLGLGWRPGATKVLVVVADAPGHEVDPVTGYTEQAVTQTALSKDVSIYGLDASDAGDTLSPLASATGGQVFTTDESSAVPDAIANTISAQATAGYVGGIGEPVALSAAASWSPLGRALTFSWDFESDGVVDRVTKLPVVTHSWSAAFNGVATLRVTDSAGQTAVARVPVAIAGARLAVPPRPGRPKLAVGRKKLTIRWRRRHGAPVSAWVIRSPKGAVIAVAKPGKRARQRLTISRPKAVKTYRVRISALNPAGESKPVASNRVRLRRRH